jgi:hypothetical protein
MMFLTILYPLEHIDKHGDRNNGKLSVEQGSGEIKGNPETRIRRHCLHI